MQLDRQRSVRRSTRLAKSMAVVITLSLLLCFIAPALAQQAPPGVPLTSIPANAPTQFPSALDFGFEDSTVGPTNPTFYYGTLTSPANQWSSWTFTQRSGIAYSTSSILSSLTPPVPEQRRVGFIWDNGTISTSYTFAPGTYRLRFKGASGNPGPLPQATTLRVTIGGVHVGDFDLSKTQYEEEITRTIRYDVSTSPKIEFENLDPDNTAAIALIDDVRVELMNEWEDAATWNGVGYPGPKNEVTIPVDSSVAITTPVNNARTIVVNGELLAANRNIHLLTEFALIDGGKFQAGTESAPFLEDFCLTLRKSSYATMPVMTPPLPGTKFLVAQLGGEIQLHGKPKVSWTKLTTTIAPGATTFTVADPVNWEPGDEIVITGTRYEELASPQPLAPNFVDYSDHVKILSVSPNGLTITFDQSMSTINHKHYGDAPQPYSTAGAGPNGVANQWTLDQRAEVGLLTRNVKVEGDSNSVTNGVGGHIMVRRPMGSMQGASAYISHTELYRLGQKSLLGRYPMHWHMMLGLAAGQYVKNCSIHHAFNRAITIHGTDFIELYNNVVYDTIGHAFFLEDGSEQFNIIKKNLALTVRKPAQGEEVIASDNHVDEVQNRTPAIFWITNPLNYIDENVAAGTEGTGFWFALPEVLLGPSGPFGNDMDAQNYFAGRAPLFTDLGSFNDNVSHSCASGFDANDSIFFGDPSAPDHTIKANVAWDPPSGDATIHRFTAFACSSGVYTGIGNDKINFDRVITADCFEHLRLASPNTVENSLIVGGTGNSGGVPVEIGYQVYDGPGRIKNCHFENMHATSVSGARAMIVSGGAGVLHPNHLFSGVTFTVDPLLPLPPVFFLDYAAALSPNPLMPNTSTGPGNPDAPETWGTVLRDVDGTLSGIAGLSIMTNHPLICVPTSPGFIALPYPPTVSAVQATTDRFGHLRMYQEDFTIATQPDVMITREAGPAGSGFPQEGPYLNSFKRFFHKQWPVFVTSDLTYTLEWTALPSSVNLMRLVLDEVEASDSVTVKLVGVGTSMLNIDGASSVTMLSDLDTVTSTSYYVDSANSDVYVRFIGVNDSIELEFSW